jgi:DUF1680 family protein
MATDLDIDLRDPFWSPRLEQLRSHTLPVLLERLEAQGAVGNFRRLVHGTGDGFRAMHFADSDLYKWIEAAVLAGRVDLADPLIDLVVAVQCDDGYVHTHYGTPGGPPRYSDLDFGHEQYCHGHLIEAAVSHHRVTGDPRLLTVATRLADHLCATFGPGRDERTDAHPEIELALCRLAAATDEPRYLEHAAWIIGEQLRHAGVDLRTHRWGGHAVRALYLASGIAEVALATGDEEWRACAERLFDSLLGQFSYPTGAVGGRWLGEATGKPFEQPDAMSYAESCAAVAAAQFCRRIWALTGDPRALDQLELLVFNAVPCGVGDDGASWFYSQPHAVAEVAAEHDPWTYGFDYGAMMLRQWFPAHRHEWFDVPCCPPNLARMFATVPGDVAQLDPSGDLLVHLPIACSIRGGGWHVEIDGAYPADGDVAVKVLAAPDGRTVRVRRPGWAGGRGHEDVAPDGSVSLPVQWQWWTTDHRVEGAAGTVHLRRGPVVHCVEGVDLPGIDLRDLVVDPTAAPEQAFAVRSSGSSLHGPVPATAPAPAPVTVRTVPYAEWSNRGTTTMRLRFPIRR